MKKILSSLMVLFLVTQALDLQSQIPPENNGFNYQAVARDNNGVLLTDQAITITIGIKYGVNGSELAYAETHPVNTNAYGQFNLVIGGGTPIIGTFDAINWSSAQHFLSVQIDDGINQVILPDQLFHTVPYALISGNAQSPIWSLNANGTHYNGGNVGLGTSLPGEKLHLQSTDDVQLKIKSGNINDFAGTPSIALARSDGGIINPGPGDENGDDWRLENESGNFRIIQYDENSNTTHSRLFMDQEGNYGLGTSNPQANFDLRGDTDPVLRVHASSGFVMNPSIELVRGSPGDNTTDWKIQNSSGILRFMKSTNNFATDTEMMRINSDGTVDVNNHNIREVATPINGNDAANKNYVDNAILSGGVGTPQDLSDETANSINFAACATYCRDLNENSSTNWKIPSIEEIGYFAGINNDDSYLWTSSGFSSASAYAWNENGTIFDFPHITNYGSNNKILMRLSDGDQSEDIVSEDHKCRCVR